MAKKNNPHNPALKLDDPHPVSALAVQQSVQDDIFRALQKNYRWWRLPKTNLTNMTKAMNQWMQEKQIQQMQERLQQLTLVEMKQQQDKVVDMVAALQSTMKRVYDMDSPPTPPTQLTARPLIFVSQPPPLPSLVSPVQQQQHAREPSQDRASNGSTDSFTVVNEKIV